jgi:hypothetical protein
MPSSATLTAQEFNSAGAVVPAPLLDWLSLNTGVFTVPINGSGGQTAVVTATGVGSAQGSCTDPSTSVTGSFTVNVATSLGLVVVPIGVSLVGTLPALAGGGAGLATLAVRYRFLVDALLGATITASGLILISGAGTSMEAAVAASSGTLTFTGTMNGGVANAVFGTVAQSSLPVAGTGVVLYVIYEGASTVGATAAGIALLTDSGTVLFSGGLSGSSLGAVGNTPAGGTTVAIGAGSSGPGGGLTIDGAEILSANITNPATPPVPADPGALGIWGFAGVLTPTVIGATLAPSSGSVTYLSGGIWS